MVLGRSLQNNKQEKKFNSASRTSRGSGGGNGTLASKEKWDCRSKKVQTGGNRGVSHAGQSEVTKKVVFGFGKRNVKSKIDDGSPGSVAEGNRGFKSSNFDKKRKRIYADQPTAEKRMSYNNVGKITRGFSSRMVQNKLKDHFHEEKRTSKGKSLEFGELSRSLSGRRKSREGQFSDKKSSVGKLKAVDEVKNVNEGVRNGKVKKIAKSKLEVTKKLAQNQGKHAAGSPESPSKKKVHNKKNAIDDSGVMDEKPKKKK